MITRHEVTVTTDASGNATGYTPAVSGFVHAITYTPPGANALDTGADITVTGETGKHAIVTVTNLGTSAVAIYPRAATATTANAASLYAAAGTAVNDRIPVAGERVKVAIAQGGNTKTGTFHVYIAE